EAGDQKGGVGYRAINVNPAFQHMGEDQQVEQGCDDRRRNGLESHFPEAHELLLEQGRKAGSQPVLRLQQRAGAHAVTPRNSSSCMMRTNASSRSAPPTLAISACVVSSAAIRPCLSMATRRQSASASSR